MKLLPETIEVLKKFRGSVVTVCTDPINHPFDVDQHREYSVGLCEAINEDGVLIRHHITGDRTFIFMAKIVSISDEQALDPSIPAHRELIEQLEQKRKAQVPPAPEPKKSPPVPKPEPKPKPPVPNGQFVDPHALARLSSLGKALSNPRPQ